MVNRDISQFIRRCDDSFRMGQKAYADGEQLEHCPWGSDTWHQRIYQNQWRAGWYAASQSSLKPLDIAVDVLVGATI